MSPDGVHLLARGLAEASLTGPGSGFPAEETTDVIERPNKVSYREFARERLDANRVGVRRSA